MEINSEFIVESIIDSRLAVDGSVVEYRDRVVGFSQGKAIDLDVTLASGLNQKEIVDRVKVVASVTRGFEGHG